MMSRDDEEERKSHVKVAGMHFYMLDDIGSCSLGYRERAIFSVYTKKLPSRSNFLGGSS